jgi:hypothetical protein
MSFVLWYLLISLWWTYSHTKPTTPDAHAGRIYALTEYGVTVYLTNDERLRLYMLAILSFLSFLVVAVISIFIKKSLRRTQPWETRQ